VLPLAVALAVQALAVALVLALVVPLAVRAAEDRTSRSVSVVAYGLAIVRVFHKSR
jgi:hypothetical protein